MAFSTTSYFAGVGTVFAAIMLGFAGGFVISNPSQKVEPPNKVERVNASAPLPKPPDAQAAAPVPAEAASTPLVAAAQRVAEQKPVAQQQAVSQQQPVSQQPAVAPAPVGGEG